EADRRGGDPDERKPHVPEPLHDAGVPRGPPAITVATGSTTCRQPPTSLRGQCPVLEPRPVIIDEDEYASTGYVVPRGGAEDHRHVAGARATTPSRSADAIREASLRKADDHRAASSVRRDPIACAGSS